MRISELFNDKKAVFSFEVFPPKKDHALEGIYNTLEKLSELSPDFISVTYGAGGTEVNNYTAEIASFIKNNLQIEPLAHLTCINSTQKEISNVLDKFKEKDIHNILALRGDRNPSLEPKEDFKFASDLIQFIKNYDDFNISATCYPEVHPECNSMEIDIKNLKKKIDNGATHLVSQLFFDNNDFYNFMYQVRDAGITVPIQAGIMPVINKKNIERLVSTCGASLPKKFVKIMSRYENNPDALFDAGIAYATEQIIDLLSNSVQGIHLYTMNKFDVASKIKGNVDNILKYLN